MSNASDLLDRIKIPSPCQAEWHEMEGNDHVRFCAHCSKHVNNISEMTRKRALELVARSHGRLCLRYHLRPDSTILTLDSPNRLHQIRRRASRIAAGAFSAALGLSSSVAAQTVSQTNQPAPAACQQTIQLTNSSTTNAGGGSATLTGTVTDSNGAVVPGATVTLVSVVTGGAYTATTDESGQYSFQSLEARSYSLRIEAGLFVTEAIPVSLQAGEETHLNSTMQTVTVVAETTGGVVSISASNPLVIAASDNDLETVKKLINEGADVNNRDEYTYTTALDEAVMHGNRDIVRALINAGANVNARAGNKQTALMRLDEDATAALVWDLVAAGARVNARDSDGDTPLIMAAQYSTVEVVRALISAGAKINASNHEGQTALMAAAGAGKVGIVEALFNAGADINARDHDGNTALKRAEENSNSDVVEFLKIHNALEDVEAVKVNN